VIEFGASGFTPLAPIFCFRLLSIISS